MEIDFTFTAKCWLWQAEKGSWHFLALPQGQSEEIKFLSEHHFGKRRGWGAVKVSVTIGDTTWVTSIFPYSKSNAYLLPLKADVRKAEKIAIDDEVQVKLSMIV